MNKIEDGDIVEILNVSHFQIESIRGKRCNCKISPHEIIGQKYYAKPSGNGKDIELVGWNWGGYFNGLFSPWQLKVIKQQNNT